MQTHSRWVKIGAVSLSVLLAGSYVGFRAIKTPRAEPAHEGARTFMPGPKSAGTISESPPLKEQIAEPPTILLPSSKVDRLGPPGTHISNPVWVPDEEDTPQQPKPAPEPKTETVLPGSKVLAPVISSELFIPYGYLQRTLDHTIDSLRDPAQPQLPEIPQPKPRKRKVILSGSKSSPVDIEIEIEEPDEEEAPKGCLGRQPKPF